MDAENLILSCPNCGESLVLTTELQMITCGQCGNSFSINHTGSVDNLLSMVTNKLHCSDVSADRIDSIKVELGKAIETVSELGRRQFVYILALVFGASMVWAGLARTGWLAIVFIVFGAVIVATGILMLIQGNHLIKAGKQRVDALVTERKKIQQIGNRT